VANMRFKPGLLAWKANAEMFSQLASRYFVVHGYLYQSITV